MSMKKILFTYVCVCLSALATAQQLPHYSQYVLNDFVMNPAIAGKNTFIEGKSNTRYQWVGITDAPRTHIFSVNAPIIKQHMGVGGYVFTDVAGPTRRIGFSGVYSYHTKLTEKVKASLGLSAGLLQYALDGSKLNLYHEGDQVLTTGYQSTLVPDFGFGVYWYSDKYYFGLSAPQIVPSRIKLYDYTIDSRLSTHVFLTGGYKLNLGSEDMQLEPTIAVKFVDPAPVQVDIGARFHYKKKMWIGAGYRTMDAATLLLGYTHQENLTIGYSYDYTLSNLGNYNSGTHEIFLAVKFYQPKDKVAAATTAAVQ